MYQLIIVGGGPGGVAAGVYAARKKIDTLLITEEFGGQSSTSSDIQNWIGERSISGLDLAKKLEEHIKAYGDTVKIAEGERVSAVEKVSGGRYKVSTQDRKVYEAERVLVVSGSRRRKLEVPGAEKYEGKGVVYCSTCDAPIFQGKAVAVIGGGNAGLEAVVDLLSYASKIYLLERSAQLRGDEVARKWVGDSDKVEIIYNAEVQEVLGREFVSGLKYKDGSSGEVRELKLEGVFVEIGAVPNSDIVGGLVKLNERGEIIVDHKTQRTSDAGIWAAGDVCDVFYKQNNISAGDAVKAVLNIYEDIIGGNSRP
jgi:alkyl hydroperoxide reductase subunit AhpF